MAYKIAIGEAAKSDYAEIVEYLAGALGEPAASRVFSEAFETLLGNLSSFPLMYPRAIEPHLQQAGYRKAPCTSYLVLYRIADDTVVVTRIFHQRREYARLL